MADGPPSSSRRTPDRTPLHPPGSSGPGPMHDQNSQYRGPQAQLAPEILQAGQGQAPDQSTLGVRSNGPPETQGLGQLDLGGYTTVSQRIIQSGAARAAKRAENGGRAGRIQPSRLDLSRERLLRKCGFDEARITKALDTLDAVQDKPDAMDRDKVKAAAVVLSLLPKSNLTTGPKVVKHVIERPEWMKALKVRTPIGELGPGQVIEGE